MVFPALDVPPILIWGTILSLLLLQTILMAVLVGKSGRRRVVQRQVILPPTEVPYTPQQDQTPYQQRQAWKAAMARRNGGV